MDSWGGPAGLALSVVSKVKGRWPVLGPGLSRIGNPDSIPSWIRQLVEPAHELSQMPRFLLNFVGNRLTVDNDFLGLLFVFLGLLAYLFGLGLSQFLPQAFLELAFLPDIIAEAFDFLGCFSPFLGCW